MAFYDVRHKCLLWHRKQSLFYGENAIKHQRCAVIKGRKPAAIKQSQTASPPKQKRRQYLYRLPLSSIIQMHQKSQSKRFYNQPPLVLTPSFEITTNLRTTSVGYGFLLLSSEPPPTSIVTLIVATPTLVVFTLILPSA